LAKERAFLLAANDVALYGTVGTPGVGRGRSSPGNPGTPKNGCVFIGFIAPYGTVGTPDEIGFVVAVALKL
jgi:hypothetical protein